MDATKIRPDTKQIMMGRSWIAAIHELGVIPADLYTVDGLSLRMTRDSSVALDVSIVLPSDKLRALIDIVDRIEGRA